MAAGVYRVALRTGIQIPQQLSVVGYDDSPLASRLWPPLTSVRRHVSDIGRMAAAMLVQAERWTLKQVQGDRKLTMVCRT